jgi:hypothetical protein
LIKLQKTITTMVKYCAADDEECLKSLATSVIGVLEIEFRDSFLEVAKDRGYSTSLAGKMSAEYWNAMAEAANLRTTQQIQISRYLTQHFGHKVVVSQRELAAFGSEFVPYETFHEEIGGKKILYSYRDLAKLLEFYLPELLESFEKSISKIELTLGGDHGKGAFTFLACLIIRFVDNSDPVETELQIGEIGSETDTIEVLQPLVDKLGSLITASMNPKEGDCKFVVHQDTNNGDLSLHFDDAVAAAEGTQVIVDSTLELYLMGDWKFLFMMVGRSGYCGSYCMYCRLKQSEWVVRHAERNSCVCGAEEWDMTKLHEVAMKQLNIEADEEKYESQGVKGFPCWEWLPLKRVLIPVLHELLGLGNDLFASSKSYIEEAVEPLMAEEKQARTMALLAELAFEEAKNEEAECALDVEFFVIERRQLSTKLAMRRTLAVEVVQSLEVQKIELLQLEKDTRKKRNDFRTKKNRLKKAYSAAKAEETAVRARRGRKEKSLANSIQSEVLDPLGCKVSSYHGGDMEGEAIRILMSKGREIFAAIEAHVKAKIEAEKDLTDKEKTLDVDVPELEQHCEARGTMFQLLDGIFSLLLTKRGMLTTAILDDLRKRLELARVKWAEMGLSMTPKWHMLLNHAVELLIRTGGGLVELGEDRIERAHQWRERDRQRYSRLRCISKMAACKAKIQNLRMMAPIKKRQSEVKHKSKRKREGPGCLKDDRAVAAKVERDGVREMVVQEVTVEPRESLRDPRKRMKKELKDSNRN